MRMDDNSRNVLVLLIMCATMLACAQVSIPLAITFLSVSVAMHVGIMAMRHFWPRR